MAEKNFSGVGDAIEPPKHPTAVRHVLIVSSIAFSVLATLPATVSANGMAWSPYEEFLMMMAFIFMFNLPINLGTYVLLLWMSSARVGASIYANKTRHFLAMTVFVAVAATFFGAIIDIYLVMSNSRSDSFLGFFILGLFCVVVSFILLGRYLQRLDAKRLEVVAAGIGLMNLASWIYIFALQVTPWNFMLVIGIIVFSILITFLFALWHKSGYEPDDARPGRIRFTRREGTRAGVLGAFMLLFVVIVIILANADRPDYYGHTPISGALYYLSGDSSPRDGEATFRLDIMNPSAPSIDNIRIIVLDDNGNRVADSESAVVWTHLDSDESHVVSHDLLHVFVPDTDISGYIVYMVCEGYVGTIEETIPESRSIDAATGGMSIGASPFGACGVPG